MFSAWFLPLLLMKKPALLWLKNINFCLTFKWRNKIISPFPKDITVRSWIALKVRYMTDGKFVLSISTFYTIKIWNNSVSQVFWILNLNCPSLEMANNQTYIQIVRQEIWFRTNAPRDQKESSGTSRKTLYVSKLPTVPFFSHKQEILLIFVMIKTELAKIKHFANLAIKKWYFMQTRYFFSKWS